MIDGVRMRNVLLAVAPLVPNSAMQPSQRRKDLNLIKIGIMLFSTSANPCSEAEKQRKYEASSLRFHGGRGFSEEPSSHYHSQSDGSRHLRRGHQVDSYVC